MIPPEGQKIIDWVAQNNPWMALGISKNAPLSEASAAHLKLRHKFHEYPEVEAALNEALNEVKNGIGKKQPLPAPVPEVSKVSPVPQKSGFTTFIASLIVSWPVRICSIAGTVLVLLYIKNLIITIIAVGLFVFYLYPPQKNNTDEVHLTPGILLAWGGFSASIFLVLNKLIHWWAWVSIVLAIPIGLVLTALGFDLLGELFDKLLTRSFWVKIGVCCVIFMLTFGLENLLITQAPVTAVALSSLSYIQSNLWLYRILLFSFDIFLIYTLAGFFSGAYFSKSKWYWIWDESSEFTFFSGLIATWVSVNIIDELLYYLPFFRDYIGQRFIGDLSNPISDNLTSALFFYGVAGLLAIPVYFILISIVKQISNKTHLILNARVLLGALSFIIGEYLYSLLIAG